MTAEYRAHDRIGGQRLEQGRVIPALQRRKVARGVDQFMAEARGCLAPRLIDRPRRKTRQRYGIRDQQFRQRAEAGLEPVDKPRQTDSLPGESSPEAPEARCRTRAADCLFELTRKIE